MLTKRYNIDYVDLKGLNKGDENSFKRIYDRYSNSLYKFSYSYLKSKEIAEDVVQEVFITIWDNRKKIEKGFSFQSYLFTITLNVIRKKFKKIARRNELKYNVLKEFSKQKDSFDDNNNYYELLEKLHYLVDKMPEKRKQIFIKKKFEEKSLKEIALELGVSVKTVEYHITESMKFLKREFEKLHINGIIFFHLFISRKNILK